MKKTQKNLVNTFVGGVAVTIVTVSICSYVETIIDQRRIRKEIAARTEQEIAAIHKAGDIVRDKISAGEYDKTAAPIAQMLTDLEFYTMIEFVEK